MDLSIGLRQTQVQKLIMTQKLQQAIKLLQLNNMELMASLQEEMLENPALELNAEERSLSEAEMQLNDSVRQQTEQAAEQDNGAQTNEIDWARVLEEQNSSAFKTGAGAGYYDDLPPIENTLSTSPDLAHHLIEQLGTAMCTDEERRAALVMIHNLDENGWLDMEWEEVASEAEVDLDDVEGAAEIVQQMDPLGCASRTLGECLLVQIKVKWPEDPFFPELIENHLGDFENRNYGAIASAMDMDEEDVIEYHKMLRQLEPCPGRPFKSDQDQSITPDIEVIKVGNEWRIVQNEDGLPRLKVSSYYRTLMQGGAQKDEKRYVEERLKAARFLIESIYKRQRTIHRVMEAILQRQRDFFEYGPEGLKPMVLRDIADEIGVHESTVSRATTNKYVQCPHGIFELKHFFNAAIRKTNGGEVGAEAVKEKLRKLLAEENRKKPLSDSDLAKMLKKDGINIARRTVAKYREAMGILPSNQRKMMF